MGKVNSLKKTDTSPHSLVAKHEDYARRLVSKVMKRYCLPSSFREDLTSAAFVGLVEASERYDSSLGVSKFTSYSYLRIQGAVMDEVRSYIRVRGGKRTSVSKRHRKEIELVKKVCEVESHEISITERNGIDLQKSELALENVLEYVSNLAVMCEVSISSNRLVKNLVDRLAVDEKTPETDCSKSEYIDGLKSALNILSELERFILKEYYVSNRSFSEIGKLLKGEKSSGYRTFSSSWVSRVHKRAIVSLRHELTNKGYS